MPPSLPRLLTSVVLVAFVALLVYSFLSSNASASVYGIVLRRVFHLPFLEFVRLSTSDFICVDLLSVCLRLKAENMDETDRTLSIDTAVGSKMAEAQNAESSVEIARGEGSEKD